MGVWDSLAGDTLVNLANSESGTLRHDLGVWSAAGGRLGRQVSQGGDHDRL